MIFDTLNQFISTLPEQGRLLGLDIGEARIGIATADATRCIATPHSVYDRRNMSKDLGHINKLACDEEACGIVMGLPLELDGSESEGCKRVRHFAAKLHKKSALPVFLADERMSTAAVTRAMSESHMTRQKRQSKDDKLAAAYILQGVLDTLK